MAAAGGRSGQATDPYFFPNDGPRTALSTVVEKLPDAINPSCPFERTCGCRECHPETVGPDFSRDAGLERPVPKAPRAVRSGGIPAVEQGQEVQCSIH